MRIVVADDHASIRELVRLCLDDHAVLEATTGKDALDIIRRERPDVAILDIAMPELSGLEVAQALAEDPATSGIRIVICTAGSLDVPPAAQRSMGVCAVFLKPFSVAALREAVDQALVTRETGLAPLAVP